MLLRNGLSSNCIPLTLLGFQWQNFARDERVMEQSNSGGFTSLSAYPTGYSPHRSLIPPRKAGNITSLRLLEVSMTTTGAMLRGYPISGAASFSIVTNTPAGELIVSGSGTTSLNISTNTPLLTASIGGAGTAGLSITTNAPILGALADGAGLATMAFDAFAEILPENDESPLRSGVASFAFSASLIPYAIGSMSGSTLDDTVLTGDSIATAVWSAVAEAGYTYAQVLRILASQAAGAATDLAGASPQFTGLDGTTVRIDGAMSGGTRTINALNGD